MRKEGSAFLPRARDEKKVLKRLLRILRTYDETARRVEEQDKSPDEP